MMHIMISLILWPFTKATRICLRFKCVYWDNGHVWRKARQIKDTSGKQVISLYHLYECGQCGQCMGIEK